MRGGWTPYLLLTAVALIGAPARSQAAPPATSPAGKPSLTQTPKPAPRPAAKGTDFQAQAKKFKLQAGANGKLCRDCHKEFEPKLKKSRLHPLIKQGDCTGCHLPHVSDHGKLLAADGTKLCNRCHQALTDGAVAIHAPMKDPGCAGCHDAHGSEQDFLLTKAPREACAECHKEVVALAAKASYKHEPLVKNGCTQDCHNPHASNVPSGLLRQAPQALCLSCHKLTEKVFIDRHSKFPVAEASCIGCHDPHGSSQKGMLYNDVHKPVAEGNCDQCHPAPAAGQPVTTLKVGVELCTSCHEDAVSAMFAKKRVHFATREKRACLHCHAAHASAKPKLVRAGLTSVCGECHADTLARHDRSPTKHKPVGEANCEKCHSPHSSDAALGMDKDGIAMCGQCHEWQKHSSHPIGPKYKDQRNPNLTLDCLSCHRAHGTEYKHLMPAAATSLLCTQCHERYKE